MSRNVQLESAAPLSGLSGHWLVRELRGLPEAAGGRIPAIAVSGLSRGVDLEQSRAAGFDIHLAKPVDIAVLVESVERLARRACPTRED